MANSAALIDGPARIGVIEGLITTQQETTLFAKGNDGLFTADLEDLTFVRDLGYTSAAATITFGQTTRERRVQQKSEPVKVRRTARSVTVATSLAEVTLENLALVIDGVLSGNGSTLEPRNSNNIVEFGIVVDGVAPSDLGRRLLVRRNNSTGEVALAYDSENDTVLAVTFTGTAPDDGRAAWKMVDETVVVPTP